MTDVVVAAEDDVVAAVVVIAGERVVVLRTTKMMTTTLNYQVAVGSKEQRSSLTTPSHDSIRNNSSSDTSLNMSCTLIELTCGATGSGTLCKNMVSDLFQFRHGPINFQAAMPEGAAP